MRFVFADDFCSNSRDPRLCREVDDMKAEMRVVKEYISSQSHDMKLLLGLFSKYEQRLLKQEKHTKRRIEYEASKMASRFDDLSNSTTSRFDNLANSTTSRLDDLAKSTTSRLDDITYTARSRLDDIKVALEEKIDSKVRQLASYHFIISCPQNTKIRIFLDLYQKVYITRLCQVV